MMMNFKTPAELKISEQYHKALVDTLTLFESGKLKHHSEVRLPNEKAFSLVSWRYGSVRGATCIGGWVERLSGLDYMKEQKNWESDLDKLFFPNLTSKDYHDCTVEQAATALRNFLTYGDPRWSTIFFDSWEIGSDA